MTDSTTSPCVKLCVMDEARGHCLGCGRTLDEITQWIAMGEDARRVTRRRADARLAATSPPIRPQPG